MVGIRARIIAGLGVAGMLALGACAVDTTALAASGAHSGLRSVGAPVRRVYGGIGPVRFIVELSGQAINTAEVLNLSLTARSRPGWTVSFPKIGRSLGKFTVSERATGQKQLTGDNSTVRTDIYTLEPFLPGRYDIPVLSLVAKKGSSTVTLTSVTIPVTVTSLIPKGTKRPLELKGLEGPVAGPSAWPEVLAGGTTLVAVIAATIVMLIGRIRGRRRKRTSALPPWIRAQRELDRLVKLNLSSNGKHKEFYNGISLLVRRYIEEVFDVNAPGQTTEEFLYAARYAPALGRHRRFLSEFLEHCDLVKFAAYVPAQDEIHRAIQSCRTFIDSTSSDFIDRTGEESQDR